MIHRVVSLNRMSLMASALVLGIFGVSWVVFSSAATACSTAAPCTNSPVAAAKWQLTFSDEFNGTALDASKWNTGRWSETSPGDAPFNGNEDAVYYDSSAVAVNGGAATITLRSAPKVVNGVSYPYASGEFNSENKQSLKPGDYVEARILIPQCDGCLPAFWASPSGKRLPEFDVFKYFDTATSALPSFNYHSENSGQLGPITYGEAATDYRAAYHVYGMYWTGNLVIPYLDGKPYPLGIGATTTIPEHLIFDLSAYAGHKPADGAKMLVDWVRIWTPVANSAPVASSSPIPQPTPEEGITAGAGGCPIAATKVAGLLGCYYAGDYWGGSFGAMTPQYGVTYAGVRVDSMIDFSGWGQTGPRVASLGKTNFSVEWQGYVTFPKTGKYTFTVTSDDNAYLSVDDMKIIVDSSASHAAQTFTGSTGIVYRAGQRVPIDLKYHQGVGPAVVKLGWSGPGIWGVQVVPEAALATQ